MILFTKPANLNGTELLDELKAIGISVIGDLLADDNGNLWLDIKSKDEAKAKAIIAAHNGTTVPPDLSAKRQAILDRLGLTADEAKLLLGGN